MLARVQKTLGLSRVRTILVLGYWALGDIQQKWANFVARLKIPRSAENCGLIITGVEVS